MSSGPASASSHADVRATLANALKLGGALVLTLVIGFGVRLALRRSLGPTALGPLGFAEAFAATGFVVLGLGLDVYLRTVVPVRLEAANAFLGAFLLVRAALAALVFAGLGLALDALEEPPEVRALVWAYGAAQVLLSLNQTFTSLLQSARAVDGLSVVNVASKLLWAAGFVATLVFRWPLLGIPLSVAAAEALKAAVGWRLARKHLGLRLGCDWSQVGPVLRASFAFYVNTVALVVVNHFGVNALKVHADDTEIGLYSAAAELSQMTFVLTPMLGGVVAPLFARTRARGEAEFAQVLRRTLEWVLAFAFPASLAILVGADVWVRLLLGPPYAASAWALAILGPGFLLTYATVIVATALNLSGGAWTVTVTSLLTLALNPLLVLGLVPLASSWGPGGGGAACALAAIATEALALGVLCWRTGRAAVDARLLWMLAKTGAACAAVYALDRALLSPLGAGRLVLDGALYAGLVLASGAVSTRDTAQVVRLLRAQRAAVPPDA
jgi:O-antigen/teichoic acid export membrane protein